MSKRLQIRSWLWAALGLCVAGSIIGATLAVMAVRDLSARASRLATFERAWSEAVSIDRIASEAALAYATHGNAADRDRFARLSVPREEALATALELAPKRADPVTLQHVYKSARGMETLESAAVALRDGGRANNAQTIMRGPAYAQEGVRKTRLQARAKGELRQALEAEVDAAFVTIGAALAALFTSMLAGAFCWIRVAMMLRQQAADLSEARDALAAHAATLEVRIEARTRDLEAAKLAAEAADRAKSSFLAQMSHEIRTPMNGVLGMADALSRTPLDERQTRMVKVIQDSGDTLLSLLNDVLDLAKVEAGQLELETVDFNLLDIARSAESIFTTRAHDKGISFAVVGGEGADAWCLGDPTRVRQVLYNLVSNAVKFTAEGAVSVTLRSIEVGEKTREVTFEVTDTGIGMSPEVIGRLFSRFSQADASTTRLYGGTGLGLAICRQLAEMMDGSVTVTSAPGQGSTFLYTFRAPEGAAPERVQAAELGETLAGAGEPAADLRILAAEDNSHNRLVLQMFLEQLGIEPVFAENGEIAVDLWKQSHFDLILMDVQMPEMSGPEATVEIRRLERETGRARTPIIALTANAMTHHVNECFQAGMDGHVAKPIRPELLFAAMEAALSPVSDPFDSINGAATA